MAKAVVYYPPAADIIERFVRSACFDLGAAYTNPDAMSGFADFMKAVARAQANNLNHQANPNRPDETGNPD